MPATTTTPTLPLGEISPAAKSLCAEIDRERWQRMNPDNRQHARLAYRWMRRDGMSRRGARAAAHFLILAGGAAERTYWTRFLAPAAPTSGRGQIDRVLEDSGRPWGDWSDCSVEIDAPALVG